MIQLTHKAHNGSKRMTLQDVQDFCDEALRAGIDPDATITANVTLGQKLKMIQVEG